MLNFSTNVSGRPVGGSMKGMGFSPDGNQGALYSTSEVLVEAAPTTEDGQPWVAVEEVQGLLEPGAVTRWPVVVLHQADHCTVSEPDSTVVGPDFVQIVGVEEEVVGIHEQS